MVRQSTEKKRDAVRTRAAILAGAILEFAAHGPVGTRLDNIAAHAGIHKSLIYQYFGSKHELYAQALLSVLARITHKSEKFTRELADAATDLHTHIRRYLENHLALLESVPEYPRLMAWENLHGGGTLARMPLQATYRAFLARVAKALAPLRSVGMLRADFDPSRVAQAVMALTHYFVIQQGTLKHLFNADPALPANRDAWLDYCTDMLISSFAQETGAASASARLSAD